ncbi:hypothetical protein [Magnetospirillum sulfuroxidans]|uniref:AAA+ ATPase domain-containing protein n=1 Tax=Magnetospirillum sulfuroxidans TaxID=611300 RepID=A0ABS5IC78_9PROT|nr:hypothetical protein [Magnetospirillum sulfuroxidans]MBR9971298.1 hypothetical protein [Magnetospirillum sulfuroxidans]
MADGELLYLEVAEDYAIASREALAGVQVKDTAGSGNITLQSANVRAAIDSFVDLVTRNPGRVVSLHYLTTSDVGIERSKGQRVDNESALLYWRRAAAGADVAPLRVLLTDLDLKPETKAHIGALTDDALRREFLGRIHWFCGAPGLDNVRADLEAGLIEYAATVRRLSSQAAKAVLPAVVERLLMTAVSDGSRQLRKADLIELIDNSTLVSVPQEQLLATLQWQTGAIGFSRPSQLTPSSELPLPMIITPREELVAVLDTTRRTIGLVIATGATGLGKSFTARLVAKQTNKRWLIANFRDLGAAETAARLSLLIGELTASPAASVILDDLNEVDDPAVRDLLIRLLAGLRRRDETAIFTTYRAPTSTTLHQLCPAGSPVVEIPYLSEDEVADLVEITGGEAKYAGVVYRATSRGHPQLTMAALLNLAAAGWSRASLAAVLGGQPQTELNAERRAVRQRLVTAMSAEAQTLLFRTAVIEGSFDRKLAMALGEIRPAIPLAGLVLDRLIGPWIEPIMHNRLRVSPLLQGTANDVFPAAECRMIHERIVKTLLHSGSVSVLDAGVVLRHALKSESPELVVAFASSLIACNPETLDMLSPFVGELLSFKNEAPIFPQDLAASAMLRFAQMLLLLSSGSAVAAQQCWEALERERKDVKGATLFEGLLLSKLLLHPRAGEFFPNWINLLLRLDQLTQSDEQLAATSGFQSTTGDNIYASGVMFASQMRNIRTVRSFREIFEQLNCETAAVRERFFSTFRLGSGDISILVNHGWLKESRSGGFDWEGAASDYATCVDLAMGWQNPTLAARCAIAQAICYDEFGDDPVRALASLSEAEQRFGADVALSRARAKIHWRRRDFATALPLLTAAAAQGGQDPLERAYIAREAGISAAELGDWEAAQNWFDRAQVAASGIRLPSVRAQAIGLLADTAHAAYHAGHHGIAIRKLRDALILLPTVDPDGELTEAHCHRVVRHAVLWLLHEITGRLSQTDMDIQYAPGCASNPDPVEAIRSHPVAALDMAFYLLADADEALTQPTGFYREFRNYLADGPILSLELSRAIAEARKAISTQDTTDFVSRLRRHAAMAAFVSVDGAKELVGDLHNPRRGTIPLAGIDADAGTDVLRGGADFLLSFAIAAAINGNFEAVDTIVEVGLKAPELVALHPLFERMAGRTLEFATEREAAALAVNALRQDIVALPAAFLWCGIWMLLHVRASQLSDRVADPLISWIFDGWGHLAHQARFRLTVPVINVPPIEAVLPHPDRTLGAAARLLLAAAPAASVSMPSNVRASLYDLAARTGS